MDKETLKPDQPDHLKQVSDLEKSILSFIDELSIWHHADARWKFIAKTDIEKGFMALRRSIAMGPSTSLL